MAHQINYRVMKSLQVLSTGLHFTTRVTTVITLEIITLEIAPNFNLMLTPFSPLKPNSNPSLIHPI